MTELHGLLLIGVVAVVTILIRSAPFLLFPADKPTPGWVLYLGQMLPSAVIGMLIVYCLRGATPLSFPYGIPEGAALLTVVFLHLWKRNTLLSIAGGTVFYMLLVQLVF